jgi:hypothetical protein
MINQFEINPNGSGRPGTLIKMVATVATLTLSMCALGEEAPLISASGKPIDTTRKKTELRALPYPATSSIDQCGQILQGLSDQSDQVVRVRKILKDNLHWRGTVHLVFPRRVAIQTDIDAAHSALTEDDIPVLVSLIGHGELKDGMRSIAFGVLGKFGAKALPCIEGGIAMYRGQGASDLSAVKINIEIELQHPDPNRSPSPRSDQPHTEKGGK